jgi:hypothetical protein
MAIARYRTPQWRGRVQKWLDSLRVETQGVYSLGRVVSLASYDRRSRPLRTAMVLLLTPLPCLVVTLTTELIPLVPPSRGQAANWTQSVRSFCLVAVLSIIVHAQFAHYLPSLSMSRRQNIVQSILVSMIHTTVVYVVGCHSVYPIPFALVTASPIWITLVVGSMMLTWGRAVRQRYRELRQPIINSLAVWLCQFGLIGIYPAYYFVYNALSPAGRMALTFSLPAIKLFLRVWFNSSVVHLRDELPEVVVTNVEVFNALFMMYCMQLTPSLLMTLGLMLLDFAQSVISLHDISVIATEASYWQETLRAITGEGLTLSMDSHVERAAAIIEPVIGLPPASSLKSSRGPTPKRKVQDTTVVHVSSSLWHLADTKVAPAPQPTLSDVPASLLKARGTSTPIARDQSMLRSDANPSEAKYVDAVQRLLYVAEFLMLLNYVELIVPVIYGSSFRIDSHCLTLALPDTPMPTQQHIWRSCSTCRTASIFHKSTQ